MPAAGLRIPTWNARALICRDYRKCKKKINALRKVLHDNDIVAIQECHGSEVEVRAFLRHELQQFEAFFARGLGRNARVVVTLVRRKLLAKAHKIGFKEVQPGRISRSLMRAGQSHVIVWNVHNDSIEEADMKNDKGPQ